MQGFPRSRNVLQLGTGPCPSARVCLSAARTLKGNIGLPQLRGKTFIICLGQAPRCGWLRVAVCSNRAAADPLSRLPLPPATGQPRICRCSAGGGRFDTVPARISAAARYMRFRDRHSGRVELPRLHLLIHQGAGHNIHAQAQPRYLPRDLMVPSKRPPQKGNGGSRPDPPGKMQLTLPEHQPEIVRPGR